MASTTQTLIPQTVGPFPISYVPDATAALTITEGVTTFGPYPATVTQTAGVYSLSATTADLIVSGLVSAQPGTLVGTTFTAIGPPLPGTLGPNASDLDLSAGPGVFGIAEGASVAEIGSAGALHILMTATAAASGVAYDLAGGLVLIALTTAADPLPADWKAGAWETRTATPGAGLYAVLPLTGLSLPAGRYRAYAQTAGYILRAPGFVTFE